MAKTGLKKVRVKRQKKKFEFTWDKILLLVLVGAFISFYSFMSVLNKVDINSIGRAVSDGQEQEQENGIATADIRSVVEITDADHLDSEKRFISDITKEVKYQDNKWSSKISDQEYVRVVFEQQLDSSRDIKVYPRIVSGTPRIEVYEKDKDEIIATFNSLTSNDYNQILLTNLQGSQDTFDLKVVGGIIELDQIIDPQSVGENDK